MKGLQRDLGRSFGPHARLALLACLWPFLAALAPAPQEAVTSAQQPVTSATSIAADGTVTHLQTGPGHTYDPTRTVPGEFLVRLKPRAEAASAQRVLSLVAAQSMTGFRSVPGLYHVKLGPQVSLHDAAQALVRDSDVLYIEPNFVLHALGTPNDPSFPSLWGLRNTGQTGGTPGADIGAVAAWDITTGSPNVVVAVIDTGVDYNHPDLAANVFANPLDCDGDGVDDDGNGHIDDCHGIDAVNNDSNPMDDNGHGTHVAGTIGAVGNNALGVVGVNWSVKILPCKFLDFIGRGDTAGAIACLDYLAAMKDAGANIVASNNSWGGGLFSQALLDAIDAHRQRGILFIAAAGNQFTDNDFAQTFPCSYGLPNIICVAATDARDSKAPFSNVGRRTVHLGAPGVDILSTTPGNTYSTFSGTSMATPHVSGAVGLLYAQVPSRDWRGVKNLLLAGGDTQPALASTISGRRLNALGALTCSNRPLLARLRPAEPELVRAVGMGVDLSVLNINCDEAAGAVTVSVLQSGETVLLRDDGVLPDPVAGDGVYSGTWSSATTGTFDLQFPDGTTVRVTVDAHLRPGFPVKALQNPGSYHGGPAINTLVGNIDGDPDLEILASSLPVGPLYAWKADGRPAPGWPPPSFFYPGLALSALGEFSVDTPGLEVFTADFQLTVRSGSAVILPGWPLPPQNVIVTPPSSCDVDGDGLDEIFLGGNDYRVHAYHADGTILDGWPTVWGPSEINGPRQTPAIADLDGDGEPEIITTAGTISSIHGLLDGLYAHHRNGQIVTGFPVAIPGKNVDTFPVVGDLDGDNKPEIVVASPVRIYTSDGSLKRTIPDSTPSIFGTALALADLDGDGLPEIVMQTDTTLNVWHGDGTPLPGWPVQVGTLTRLFNASPVVGDVDGDGLPDIVALALTDPGAAGNLLAFDRHGNLVPGFPKYVPYLGAGAVPAIADLDGDGRNEIIVSGNFWNGQSGNFDKVWVYGLGGSPHGPVAWGQFMGNARHDGRYRPVPFDGKFRLGVERSGNGTGQVVSDPPGVDCGSDCAEMYPVGVTVALTATPAAGSIFKGWTGDCAGQGNPCTVSLETARHATANFVSPGTDTLGIYRPSQQAWYLRNANTQGFHDVFLYYGADGDIPVVGDWDGDGVDTVGVYRPSQQAWYLRNSNTQGFHDVFLYYGADGDIPVVGDWDGDGIDTIGVYRPSERAWYLRNSNTQGFHDLVLFYGADGDIPVAGDWDGDGVDTIGVYRPSEHAWYLRNSNTQGFHDLVLFYGADGDIPVVGDWNGDRVETIGVYRPSERAWYLRNANTQGFHDMAVIYYGADGDLPVVGDWDGRP